MKDKLMMVVFVLVLGTILTSSLVLVDQLTAPMIAQNASIKLKSSVLEALGIPYEKDNIDQTYANNVKEVTKDGLTYYVSGRGQIAIPFDGSGLWGPITGIMALKPNLDEIAGITIMHQEETPGLGSRIAEPDYLQNYVGKRFSPNLVLVAPGRSTQDNQVDPISGATLSSKAFLKIVNNEYDRYAPVLEGAR